MQPNFIEDYKRLALYNSILEEKNKQLEERCERLEGALRALVDYDSEEHGDTSLLDNGPLWDQAEAALSEKSP